MGFKINLFFYIILNYGKINYYLGGFLLFFCFLFLYFGLIFYMEDRVVFLEWEIFNFWGRVIIILVLLDWVRLLFRGFVFFISGLVLIYRFYYIIGDPFIKRFIILVYLFVLSMLLIILSPNIIRILLG